MKGYPGLYSESSEKSGTRFRIVINHNKQVFQEYFYYNDAKSKAEAKKKALERWHKLRKKFPVLTKRGFREVPRNTSSSGITGVTRISKICKGYEYTFWKATWTTKRGLKRSQQFSITKYGERNAKKLAIQARNEALDLIGEK